MIKVLELNAQFDNVPPPVVFDHCLPIRTVTIHIVQDFRENPGRIRLG